MHPEIHHPKNVRTRLTLVRSLSLLSHIRRSSFDGSPGTSKPPRPAAVFLAILLAATVLTGVAYGLGHTRQLRPTNDPLGATRTPGGDPITPREKEDEKDDPNQVDTIVVGDAADAPRPAHRGDHVSPVHATILVQLPRYGEQFGLIPDSPAGHLLYRWLAAFNQASYSNLQAALPTSASASTAAIEMALREQNGGFNLLSAKEIEPGLLVFRLRDQTKEGVQVLGTLQLRKDSNTIANFSLRAIPPAPPQPRCPSPRRPRCRPGPR